MIIREVEGKDLQQILELYLHLHEQEVPQESEHLSTVWNKILTDENYHLIVAEEEGKIVSSITCIIVPNLTRNVTSYALLENAVTHKDYRGRGLVTACIKMAEEIAVENECYKIMFITGSSNPKTHGVYKNAGFFSEGKTAYYKLLKEVSWSHQ